MGEEMSEGNNQPKGLENLQVWQKSLELAVRVCRDILPSFPVEEKWSLCQQLRRAVQSVPANLAEGHGRYYYQENAHFVLIARGSLEEALSQLTLAFRLGYIDETVFKNLKGEIDSLMRSINSYLAYIKRSKAGANEIGSINLIRETYNDAESGPDSQDTDLQSLFSDHPARSVYTQE